MKLLHRFINLGNYLSGNLIVISVKEDTTAIDAGFVDNQAQHRAAVDFFHNVYTKKT